ncbi:unnamed protein product [Vicia faba]|uniref:F-box protein n=1 Tax=Vicia faba TaxID=3906 RepID=A0AAV1B6I1_VICFA|nr:unnamed protein product [Vicia faba]
MFHTNFISISHSYYNNTSLVLNKYVYDHNNRVWISLYLLSSERFENRFKLDYPNPFKNEVPQFHILNSSSITGILCLYLSNEILLWNPTTDEFKVIPHSSVVDVVPPYLPMDEHFMLPPGVKWKISHGQEEIPPAHEWIKANFDGVAIRIPTQCVYGAMFHNSNGDHMGSFSFFIGADNSLLAKFMGAIMVMEVALDKNWDNL